MPDATGQYVGEGIYQGAPYYHKAAGHYCWFDPSVSYWYVTVVLGTLGAAYWRNVDPTVLGTYSPKGTATGDGTMAPA